MGNSVKLERRESVAIVTLNRPDVLNAVNMAMRETLITLLAELNKAEDVRAVVLTGEEVMVKSLALAAEMAKLAPTALRLTKQRFRALTQAGFDAALEAAKAAQKEAYASGEPQEAMRKFLEARKTKKN